MQITIRWYVIRFPSIPSAVFVAGEKVLLEGGWQLSFLCSSPVLAIVVNSAINVRYRRDCWSKRPEEVNLYFVAGSGTASDGLPASDLFRRYFMRGSWNDPRGSEHGWPANYWILSRATSSWSFIVGGRGGTMVKLVIVTIVSGKQSHPRHHCSIENS